MSNRRKPPRSIYEQPQGFVDDIPDDEFFNSQLVMAAEALERKMQDTPPPPMTAPVTSSHIPHASSNVSGSANSAPLSYHTTSAYHASSASSASSGFASSNVSSMNSMNAHSSMRTSRASVQTTTPVYTSKPPTPTIPDAAFDTVMQPSDLSKEASSSESSAASATSHNAHVGTTMTPANPVPPNASQLNPNEREQFLSAIEALQTQMKQKDYSIMCAQGELEVLRRRAATAEKERFDVLKQLKSQKYVPSSSTVGASNMSSSSAAGNTAASVALSASGASQMDALKKKIEQLETQLAFKEKDIAELQSFQSVGQRSQPPSATKSSNNMLRITQTQPGASMVRSLEDSEIMHDVVPATLSSSVSATPRGSSSSRRPTPSKKTRSNSNAKDAPQTNDPDSPAAVEPSPKRARPDESGAASSSSSAGMPFGGFGSAMPRPNYEQLDSTLLLEVSLAFAVEIRGLYSHSLSLHVTEIESLLSLILSDHLSAISSVEASVRKLILAVQSDPQPSKSLLNALMDFYASLCQIRSFRSHMCPDLLQSVTHIPLCRCLLEALETTDQIAWISYSEKFIDNNTVALPLLDVLHPQVAVNNTDALQHVLQGLETGDSHAIKVAWKWLTHSEEVRMKFAEPANYVPARAIPGIRTALDDLDGFSTWKDMKKSLQQHRESLAKSSRTHSPTKGADLRPNQQRDRDVWIGLCVVLAAMHASRSWAQEAGGWRNVLRLQRMELTSVVRRVRERQREEEVAVVQQILGLYT